MTPEQLKDQANIIWKFITAERKMREQVFRQKPTMLVRKLDECDKAIAALREIKAFADQHTEEPPEQVMLFDDLPEKKGGY